MSTPVAPAADLSLSEMLHVLDVARTLREEKQIIESELNKEELLASLRERLLAAAAAAGDDVTQAEVDAAIEIYFDNLHKYSDPPLSLSVMLAHLYVLRRRVAVGLTAAAICFVAAWGLFWSPSAPFSSEAHQRRINEQNQLALEQREEQLDAAVDAYSARLAAARAIAEQERAIEELNRLARQGDAAVSTRNQTDIERVTAAVAAIDEKMREEYRILIVSDLDRRSGVIRDIDEDRLSGHYVIVEAHSTTGRVMQMDITSRETDETNRVTEWGELVTEEVFERVRQDKESDGVLDERLFAVKRPGWLDEEVMLTGADGEPLQRGGQITEW